MTAPQISASDFYIAPEVKNVLDGIGLYAKEHKLTAEQVKNIFDAGLAAAHVLSVVNLSGT